MTTKLTLTMEIRKLMGVLNVSSDFDYKKELAKGIAK